MTWWILALVLVFIVGRAAGINSERWRWIEQDFLARQRRRAAERERQTRRHCCNCAKLMSQGGVSIPGVGNYIDNHGNEFCSRDCRDLRGAL